MAQEEISPSGVASVEVEVLPKSDQPEEQLDTIYGMYMRHIPLPNIAKAFNVSVHHVKALAKEGKWEKERNELNKDIKKAVKQAALSKLNSITTNGLLIVDICIKNTIKKYKDAKRVPSTTEAETILKMVKIAHAMKHFEESHNLGGADSGGLNPEEVIQSFMDDPYMRKVMASDNLVLPPKNNLPNGKNEDTFDRSGGERSASQEARSLTARIE